MQEKILRVLEYQEFERVGGTETINVDVRVIAATNRDLPALCRKGDFREDLLDRLSFEVITLPPLRERREDIPLLINVFAMKMAREMELKNMPKFTETAVAAMIEHDWPGNIRELKNNVERAVYRSQGEAIDEISFDPFASPYRPEQVPEVREGAAEKKVEREPSAVPMNGMSLPEAVEELERRMVNGALKKHNFKQKSAAEDLGISYYQFRRILKRLDLP